MFQHETGSCYITQAYNVRQTLVLMYSNSEEMHDGRRCVCVCVSVCVRMMMSSWKRQTLRENDPVAVGWQ